MFFQILRQKKSQIKNTLTMLNCYDKITNVKKYNLAQFRKLLSTKLMVVSPEEFVCGEKKSIGEDYYEKFENFRFVGDYDGRFWNYCFGTS